MKEKQGLHELSTVNKVIAVVGGKGGVGKSTVTSMLAVTMQRKGLNTAIMDGDITGASIPHAFGLKENPDGTSEGIFPVFTKSGIQVMSMNLLLSSPTEPVVWRGAVLSEYLKSFWKKVIWTDVDCMFIDMPPGTADIPITVLSLPIDGAVVVVTPQELASGIAEKAIVMAKQLGVPILGIIENQSYFDCPTCGKRHYIYGKGALENLADKYEIGLRAKIPINKDIRVQTDKGLIELFEGDFIDSFSDGLEELW